MKLYVKIDKKSEHLVILKLKKENINKEALFSKTI